MLDSHPHGLRGPGRAAGLARACPRPSAASSSPPRCCTTSPSRHCTRDRARRPHHVARPLAARGHPGPAHPLAAGRAVRRARAGRGPDPPPPGARSACIDRPDPRRLAIEVSQTARCDHLAILAEADVRGRICADQQRLLDNIALFARVRGREQGCLAAPVRVPLRPRPVPVLPRRRARTRTPRPTTSSAARWC